MLCTVIISIYRQHYNVYSMLLDIDPDIMPDPWWRMVAIQLPTVIATYIIYHIHIQTHYSRGYRGVDSWTDIIIYWWLG